MEFNVRQKRTELNMTQRDLALAVGVSTLTIQNWEYGIITPNEENMQILKKVLGIENEE